MKARYYLYSIVRVSEGGRNAAEVRADERNQITRPPSLAGLYRDHGPRPINRVRINCVNCKRKYRSISILYRQSCDRCKACEAAQCICAYGECCVQQCDHVTRLQS
jgi:hypothetical protein